MSDVSLETRPLYNIVVHEDVKEPTNQLNTQTNQSFNQLINRSMPLKQRSQEFENDIIKLTAKSQRAMLVFLGLSAAFDTIDIEIILY